MHFFETLLLLLLVAILLLQVSRRFMVPYPTMLAAAGVMVALLPGTPAIMLDPQLALALFVAPALLDAGYDLPPREVKRYWRPLVSLAVFAVLITIACVSLVGWAWAGLPIAAAIALGAIVAPPDAVAATAVLGRFTLPRTTLSVLKGESLLNDATALLVFVAAVSLQMSDAGHASFILELALAVPGGIILGVALGRAYIWMTRFVEGTLGGTLFEFVATFGAWIVAERLHLSAILCVVAYAMTVARTMPERQRPRDRNHSYSVWEAVVFLVNVLAFLLMGLQVKFIVAHLSTHELWRAGSFALAVLGIVIAVRLGWVMLYGWVARHSRLLGRGLPAPSPGQGLVVSWCGMRGLVTLATAFALPDGFPQRELIVLTAFVVVIGTLVLQGVTLGPLIRLVKLPPDISYERDLSRARLALIDTALAKLDTKTGAEVDAARVSYLSARQVAQNLDDPQGASLYDRVRLAATTAQRRHLVEMRHAGEIDDDIFHALEAELDWNELSAVAGEDLMIEEG